MIRTLQLFIGLICLTILPALPGFGIVHTTLAQHAGHSAAPAAAPAAANDPEEAEEEEAPTVEIPLDKQQLIGVKTVEVAIKPLMTTLRTVGRVEYDERKFATVNLKFEGWIEKLYVDYTGKEVKKGEPLAEVYSPELLATQQEFLNILRWARPSGEGKDESISRMLAKDADSIIEAARQRLRLWDITDEQIKKIEETRATIRTLTLYSPLDGFVITKNALQGMRVMPGEKLFDIADLSTVWVLADIYEYELPLIKAGQPARISLSYFPGKVFTAPVEFVYPTMAGETRTAKIRFSIPNPGAQLKPQMFTNVEVKIDLGRRLAIPREAIIDTGMRQIVYVDQGDGYFEARRVTVGIRTEGMVEIVRGLKAKERVASAANFLIDSEAKLRGIVE